MIYLSPRGHPNLTPDKFGILVKPTLKNSGNYKEIISQAFRFAMDNSQFTGKTPVENIISMMDHMKPYRSTCLFVVAPDVVKDSVATARLFPEWRDKIRAEGFPVAFVGQDGCTELPDCDAFFIGGSTEWKLGKQARELAREAKRLGKWVHMGRVNSAGRVYYAESIGCDSVDGTHIIYKPTQRSAQMVSWMSQGKMFLGEAHG